MRRYFWTFLLFGLLTMLLAVRLCAQTFTGDSIVSIPGRPNVYRLIGHVEILQQGNLIYSDFADYDQKTGSCQAYDNLRIYTKDNVFITGEVLDYNGTTGSYVVDRNVVLKDKDMTLKTPSLLFEGSDNTAIYTQGGEIVTGETVLTSVKGHYEGQTGLFHCYEDVVIVNPEYTIWTDTLHYNEAGFTRFQGPTNIETTDYYMYGLKGWFDQEKEQVSLDGDAYVKTKETQVLFGDSIYYDMAGKEGQAYSNVMLLDTARNCYVKSEYAENKENLGRAFFTINSRGVVVEQGDSLFVVSDTMVMTYDTSRQMKDLMAFHDVRFFRYDIQGKCDSLSYMHRDSLMEMYYEPVVWVQDYQIDGDTMKLWFADSKPDRFLVQENVFIVSELSEPQFYYNQVKGRRMWGYFNDSSYLDWTHVIGNALSIYYVLDEKHELIGVNKTESQSLKMYFKNSDLDGITVVKPKNSALYPVDRLTQRQRTLKGYHWLPGLRPLSQYDLAPSW